MSRPWTPQEDLPGVAAVMDIRAGRTPATGAVQSWVSQFGSKQATQATEANRPVYGADALGTGRPGLAFDGTDFLGGLAVAARSTSRTVVALASFAATNNRTIVGGVAAGDFAFRRDTNRRIQIIASGAAAVATDTVAVPDNTATILAVRYTQASVADFRQNGRSTTNVAPAGNALAASDTMQIGADRGGALVVGAIGTIVIADAFVSDADIARIEGWLAHANGAAGLLVDGHPYKAAAPTVETAQAPVTARGAATLGSITGASRGASPAKARGGGLLGALVGRATARVVAKARASVVLGPLRGAAAAETPSKGAGSATLGPLTGASRAVSPVKARASGTFAALAGSSTASSASEEIAARGHAVFGALTGAARGRSPIKARASAMLGTLVGIARAGRPVRTPTARTVRRRFEPRIVRPLFASRTVRAQETAAMLTWPDKDPDDVLDYAVDWSAALAGDTIASVEWIVPEDLAADREAVTGSVATIWLAGGRAGTYPRITCRVVTAGGRTIDQTIRLPVVER